MRGYLVGLILFLGIVLPSAENGVEAGALQLVQVISPQTQCTPDWGHFDAVIWQNTTGRTLLVRRLETEFVSAQTLIAEFAAWIELAHDPGHTSPVGPVADVAGFDVFLPPNGQRVAKTTDFGGNYIAIPPGEWMTLKYQCGPTFLNGVANPTTFFYVVVLGIWYE